MASDTQYCTFTLEGLYFGIQVTRVQEVIRYQHMTPVPLAPAVIAGLINLRGQIVTAMDLRQRLDLPPRPEGHLPMNVVVRTDDGAVSLLADEIGDVLQVPPSSYEQVPETLGGVARSLILGAYKLPGRLLLILDTDKAVNVNAHAE